MDCLPESWRNLCQRIVSLSESWRFLCQNSGAFPLRILEDLSQFPCKIGEAIVWRKSLPPSRFTLKATFVRTLCGKSGNTLVQFFEEVTITFGKSCLRQALSNHWWLHWGTLVVIRKQYSNSCSKYCCITSGNIQQNHAVIQSVKLSCQNIGKASIMASYAEVSQFYRWALC